MIKKIATVAVYVDDQEEALKFWTEKIGFEKRQDIDMGNKYRWLEVAPKGAESCVVIYPKTLMKNWQELKASIVFLSDDIDNFCSELKQKGVKFTDEPKQMPWGKFAIFQDVDGNDFVIRG